MLVLANIFGIVYAYRRVILVGVAGLVLILAIVFVFRACNKPPKLDQEATIKAQQAIAKEDRREMIEVLAESAVKEQGIDNSIKAAEEATDKAKQDYSKLTNEQLAAELEKRLNE